MDPVPIPSVAEVAALSGADLDRMLVELEATRRKLESAYVATLDRADATKRYAVDGHASARSPSCTPTRGCATWWWRATTHSSATPLAASTG